MSYRILLTFFSMVCYFQVFSQRVDTIYWNNSSNEQERYRIKEINLTINDSVFKSTKYRWNGKIKSIEYTGIVNGCLTSIKHDTIFDNNGNEIKTIKENHVIIAPNNSTECDSFLLVQNIKIYKQGHLTMEAQVKRLGQFADCPCGNWKFYENNEVINTMDFDSCYDSKLSNLVLMKTVWSPDKSFYLELYKEQMLWAFPGSGSDHMATIILKNKNGKILNYVSSNSDKAILYSDIEIEWYIEERKVRYSRSLFFELKMEPNQ